MVDLSHAAQAVLDEMSIIDPDYFKRRPQSEDKMNHEYNNFIGAFKEELKFQRRLIRSNRGDVRGPVGIRSLKDGIIWKDNYYVGYLELSDSSFTSRPQKRTGDLSFNDICSMEMDSFQYWLNEASIEELEVFGKFRIQGKPRKRKINRWWVLGG